MYEAKKFFQIGVGGGGEKLFKIENGQKGHLFKFKMGEGAKSFVYWISYIFSRFMKAQVDTFDKSSANPRYRYPPDAKRTTTR